MATDLESEAIRLEAQAADIRLKAAILALKSSRYSKRSEAKHAIQVFHGSLHVPKHLKAEDNSLGNRVTLRCSDDRCSVNVSIRKFEQKGASFWAIYDKEGVTEEWTHGFYCNKIASCPVKVQARLLKDVTCKGIDLITVAKQRKISLGGSLIFNSNLSHRHHMAASRLKAELVKSQKKDNDIMRLPGIFDEFKRKNPGSHAVYHVDEVEEVNVFKRCLIVPQLSISMFQYGYLRHLYAVDCGHWSNVDERAYKLLLIYATTGNNQNCVMAWAVVDGEKKENILWVYRELKLAGVDLNSPKIATIADQGSALLSSIAEGLPESFHITCSRHWLGNHPGSWGKDSIGGKNNLFWKLVSQLK